MIFDPDPETTEPRVIRGDPTPEETAAVVAVLRAAVEEEAAEGARRTVPRISAWQRAQKAPRPPVVPGPGRWNAPHVS